MSRAQVFMLTKYGGVGLKQWSIINLARQIQLVLTTLLSSSIVGFLLQTNLYTTQLKYGHIINFLANNNTTTSISRVTPMWLTCLHQNCQKIGIQLEGGWSAPLQQVGDCHIAELPARGNLLLSNQQWKLLREMFIFLQVTTISDIITARGGYFTQAASKVTPSYPSVFKWPRQQHNITNAHKSVFCQILAANINNRQYRLTQPLGARITTPNTIRKYCRAGDVVYCGNALGQWSSHSRIPTMPASFQQS